jgi:hypothetical protein
LILTMRISSILTVLLHLLRHVRADGTYKSRPDLSPPHLNITINNSSALSPGYLFIAPFVGYPDPTDHGPLQPAPYILRSDGDLVWSGFTYFANWAANLQVARWKGQDALFAFEGAHNSLHGHGHGHHTFLNERYENIRELRAGNHQLSDKHEFIVVNETTALIQIYHPLPIDLSPYGAVQGQEWIVDARFQELDIETGEVLFEWRSLDHISPHETKLPLPKGQAGWGYSSSTAWDYFHINSLAKGEDGHYLLSARHASTVYKINGTSGEIIWRLGGNWSDFTMGPEVEFGFQHHARYLKQDGVKIQISLFDNSIYGSESGGGGDKVVQIYPFSRGKYIELDLVEKTATLVKAFHPPEQGIIAHSQGSLQTLPNANVLINWGSEGQITEYDSEGRILYHAFLDSGVLAAGVQNYRAFKYNWTGYAAETPAVAIEHDSGEGTAVYVSWNGDTRTRKWRLFEVTAGGKTEYVAEAGKNSFETRLIVPGRKMNAVVVDAVGEHGQVLTTSDVERVRDYHQHAVASLPPRQNQMRIDL